MRKKDLKWITVMNHRGYQIQTFNGARFDFGYRINDPAFSPDFLRYITVQKAVEAIEKRIS